MTVKEIGLYMFKSQNYSQTNPVIMLGRKVLASPVAIPDGASYTFSWDIDLLKDLQFTEADS